MTPRDTGQSADKPDTEDFAIWQPPTLPGIRPPAEIVSNGGADSARIDPVVHAAADSGADGSRHLLDSGIGQVPLITPSGGKRRLLDDDAGDHLLALSATGGGPATGRPATGMPATTSVAADTAPVKPSIRKRPRTDVSASNGAASTDTGAVGRRIAGASVGPLPAATARIGVRRAQPDAPDSTDPQPRPEPADVRRPTGPSIGGRPTESTGSGISARPTESIGNPAPVGRRIGGQPPIRSDTDGQPTDAARIGGKRHPREAAATGGHRRHQLGAAGSAAALGAAAAGSAAGVSGAAATGATAAAATGAAWAAGADARGARPSGAGVAAAAGAGAAGAIGVAAASSAGASRRERIGTAVAARWAALTSGVAPGVREAVGPGAPPWRRWTVATSMLVPLALVFVACGVPDSTPTTAKVARAGVSSKVTGTGALRAISEQNLGFETGGKLKVVNVTVGQQVQAGQVLAAIDDFDAQSSLRKAQAVLNREQAALDRIQDAERVDATSDDAASSEEVLEATEAQADEINQANTESLEQADRRVTIARANLRRAQIANQADTTRCRKSVGGDSRRKPGEVNQPGGLQGELFVPAPVESSACDRSRKSDVAVTEAAGQVAEAIAAAQQAQQKRDVDKASQRVAVENARREARAANHEAEDAESSRPHDIEEQAAIVSEAAADITVANRDIENTVLRAPVTGKVAAINGTVGEFVNSGSPNTPLAPGSRVSLPDVTTGVGPGLDTSKGDRPGGSAFMVLDDVNTFQVVVPFEESDAAKVQPNQRVEVSFDSVPDLTRIGTVVAVAPTGTNIQDVTNYYVTIVLNEVDPRLKEGQTAQANVIIGELSNVLVVPNSAVQQGGRSGVVTVLEPDGTQRQVQVQLGMAGDGVVQVLSGLREGQLVVVADES